MKITLFLFSLVALFFSLPSLASYVYCSDGKTTELRFSAPNYSQTTGRYTVSFIPKDEAFSQVLDGKKIFSEILFSGSVKEDAFDLDLYTIEYSIHSYLNDENVAYDTTDLGRVQGKLETNKSWTVNYSKTGSVAKQLVCR